VDAWYFASRASSSTNGSSEGSRGGVGVERVEDPGFSAPRLEPEEGLGAEEAEPADLLAADHALEQEGRRGALDLPEGGDGRGPSPVNWR